MYVWLCCAVTLEYVRYDFCINTVYAMCICVRVQNNVLCMFAYYISQFMNR
jgi:hypothetical protein